MNEQEIHAHAVALWDELAECLYQTATDPGGDTSLPRKAGPDVELDTDEIAVAQQLLEIIETRLHLVTDEAQDDYYEDNRA